MGVLGNQAPRQSHSTDLGKFLAEAIAHAKKHGVSVSDVIAAKHAIELQRQNDLTCQDGDYRDEQMGGFGDRVSELAHSLGEVASAVRIFHDSPSN